MLPPSYRKVDPSASPILYYALRTTTLPLPQLDEYAETFLAQRLSTVDGVAQVQVFGSQKYAVRIQLDPQQLAAAEHRDRRGGRRRSQNGNVNLPTGILWGTDKAYRVESDGQLDQRGRLPAARRRLPQRRAGAAGGPRPGGRQRAGHQAGELVQRPARDRARRSSGSRAPTRWRSPTRSRPRSSGCGRSCRRRSRCTRCTTARRLDRRSRWPT